ncbi:hypothetical protein [Gardnerella vaginalis]|uniref:hypothetical protein n=1 Tax=Gardnerella vaginalis TaxID=2702 RepID=UPI001C0F2E2C|nr:hypothetical protein [Gardnerella vaginalis]
MSKKIHAIKHYSGINAGVGADSQPVLSKSVCAAMLAGAMVLGGGYSFPRLPMLTVM